MARLLIGSDGATLITDNVREHYWPFNEEGSKGEGAAAARGIVLGAGAVITGRGNIVGNVTNQAGFIAPGSSRMSSGSSATTRRRSKAHWSSKSAAPRRIHHSSISFRSAARQISAAI